MTNDGLRNLVGKNSKTGQSHRLQKNTNPSNYVLDVSVDDDNPYAKKQALNDFLSGVGQQENP